MAWSEHRAVGIFAQRDGGDVPLGAGALVTPQLVLTARGVATGGASLLVRTRDGRAHPATPHPWRVGDLDVALLALARPLDLRLAHPLLLLADRPLDADAPWEADGHLHTMNGALVDPWRKVGGRARSYAPGGERLSLDVTTKVPAGDGLPGAAVVVGHQVVGVVGSGVMESANDTLTATPTGRFLGDRAFREALGIADAEDALARRAEDALARVEAILREHPSLRDALLLHLPVEGPLACELVRRRAAFEVADALDAADHTLREKGDLPARRALREVMVRVLPYAADWSGVAIAGIDAFRRAQNAFDLPLSTATVAELVFAAVEARHCQFIDGEHYPVGASLVRLPGAAEEYLHPPDELGPVEPRAALLLVDELARRLAIPAQLGATHESRCRHIEAELFNRRRRATRGGEAPWYVLLDDSKGSGARSLSVWTMVTSALKDPIPSLRFVRLTGGEELEELKLAVLLREIRRSLG